MTKPRDTRTPEEAYRQHLANIRENLRQIAQAADEHILETGGAPHYGHVGDLVRLEEILTKARKFICDEEE